MNKQARQIISRCLDTIERYSLIRKGDRILVGFSGGPDSTALVHILHQVQDSLDISLAALYLNHMLRPRAAVKEEEFCRSFCEARDIVFHSEQADVPALVEKSKMGVEEASREVRYSRLNEIAHRGGYAKIAIGHHRDDRAETILFNLFRGSGRQGVIGMRPKRDTIIRPLYDLDRDDIMGYLDQNNLQYMIDTSNKSPKFTRNRIRNRILPLIRRDVSEAAVDNIVRYSEIVADEDTYLSRLAREKYQKRMHITPGGKFALDLTDRLEYDIWLWRRLIMMLLSDAGFFEIEYEEIERIVELIGSGRQTRVSLRFGFRAETSSDRLYIYRSGKKIEPRTLTIPGRYRLEYPRVSISFERMDRPEKLPCAEDVACVDADSIENEVMVTGVKPGMTFHPYGRPGSKKIGDFLTDRKYPRPLRDELPVISDDGGVILVVGLEIDHRVRIKPTTREIVKIGVETYQS